MARSLYLHEFGQRRSAADSLPLITRRSRVQIPPPPPFALVSASLARACWFSNVRYRSATDTTSASSSVATSRANRSAASRCIPGSTCWYTVIVNAGVE
jgi:hypothetical protein